MDRVNKKKLIPKCLIPAGPIEYVGMPKEEFDWMNHMFWSDPNNPKYKWFLQYAKDKYGRLGRYTLPEVVVEAKHPEKTLAENAKENIEEVKLKWNNLPTDSKVDLALTVAGFIPGLDVVADVADIGREAWKGNWGNVALGVGTAAIPGLSLAGYKTYLTIKDANKARKVAKKFEHVINEQIWRDGRNIEKYGYNPRRIIMGTPVGIPASDTNTFFHSGNFVSNLQPGTPVPQRGGYVRVKDGQIQPIDGGIGEPRIWWNKGNNYGNGEIILTTKSSKVDDQVISSPEKYKDSDIMHYSPNYYTSGAIPLDEVDVYYRNPLTGDYDHPIQYTPTTSKVEDNIYTNFYGVTKLLREEQALAEKIAENTRPKRIPYRESELISPKDMHWVKFVNADTDFDASTSFNTQFNWNKYKSGGQLIPKRK